MKKLLNAIREKIDERKRRRKHIKVVKQKVEKIQSEKESRKVVDQEKNHKTKGQELKDKTVEEIVGREMNLVWEDAEHFWDSDCYKDYIERLVSITDGEVEFENISVERVGNEYLIELVKTGKEYRLNLNGQSDWIDFTIFKKLNDIVKAIREENKGFYPIEPDKVGDQTLQVGYLSRKEYEELNKYGYVDSYVEE